MISILVLLIGYLVYSRVTEKIFAPDGRQTPALANSDGVDCVPMKTWKAFLVQLLNIAGTGPIFGALMGAVSMTYILTAPEGFRLSTSVAYPIGAAFAGVLFAIYIFYAAKRLKRI